MPSFSPLRMKPVSRGGFLFYFPIQGGIHRSSYRLVSLAVMRWLDEATHSSMVEAMSSTDDTKPSRMGSSKTGYCKAANRGRGRSWLWKLRKPNHRRQTKSEIGAKQIFRAQKLPAHCTSHQTSGQKCRKVICIVQQASWTLRRLTKGLHGLLLLPRLFRRMMLKKSTQQ